MLFLILSILSSTLVFVTFKFINLQKVNILSAIIINYLVACLAGFFLISDFTIAKPILGQNWLYISIILGILFITMLFIIGKSTEKAGVTITTLASKISVVFPIILSIWIDNTSLSFLKIAGIVLTLIAVFLALYKKVDKTIDYNLILLPLLLFFGIGMVDSMIKLAQAKFISDDLNPIFSATTFGFAGLVGLLILPFNQDALRSFKLIKTWIMGIILGFVNFGTVYFLIGALNHINPSSGERTVSFIVFGINNISIVALSALIGLVVFKEKLTTLNWVGIGTSLIAIFMLTY